MVIQKSGAGWATLVLLCLGASAPALAQEQMSEEQMQKLQSQAQQMQDCYSKVDPNAMQAMAERGQKLHEELKALCAAGKKDAAREKAIEYSKEMAEAPEMKAVSQCGEMMRPMMPAAIAGAVSATDKGKSEPADLCASLGDEPPVTP